MKFIAGWNMPGYMPETDPEGFFTWQAAWDYLYETVDRWGDAETTFEDMEPYEETLAALKAVKADDAGHPFAVIHGEHELVFWVADSEYVEVPEAQFDDIYEPVEFDEHYLIDLRDVGEIPEEHVWSLIDGDDGNVWLVSGRHENAIDHEVTAHPWTSPTFTAIAINEGA